MKNLFCFGIVILGLLFLFASCANKKNIMEYNDTLASTLILEGDTSLVYLTDYYPTMETVDSITSSSLKVLFTDSIDRFIVVSDSVSPVLNTIDFWNGGEHVSIIVIKEQKRNDTDKPRVITTSQNNQSFDATFSVEPKQVLVFWQNRQLDASGYEWQGKDMKVKVPCEASLLNRSFIRIIGATEAKVTNDLLIPLERDSVLSNISQVDRTDKQAFVLYSLMIDRFYNGDKSNDKPLNQPDVLPTVDFQGGDIKGITDKIQSGFFTDLGVNTIWMTPISQNPDDAWGLDKDPYTKFSAYHGYWPINPTVLNPHFGTESQLKEMLDEAHKRGINVIVDYVANHLHQSSHILKEHSDWSTPMYTADGRLNVRLFDDERLTTWFDTFLPTLDLEKEEVREAMTDSALYWVKKYNFDGFRHDAAKHIHESYWRLLTKKMRENKEWNHLYQIGETYGSIELIRSYVKSGMLDGQFDFNVYHTAVKTFGFEDGDMRVLNGELYKSLDSYGYHNLMGYISGNHDKPRFISVAGGTVSLSEDTKAAGRKRKITVGDTVAYDKLALLEAFMLTIPGVPCIYQGDEYGVPGANDPDNRRMMQFDNYSRKEQHNLDMVKQLIKLRRSHLPLIYGDMLPLYCDKDVMAFARVYMGETVIVALNRSNHIREVIISFPSVLNFNNKEINFNSVCKWNKNNIHLTLKPYGFEILSNKSLK